MKKNVFALALAALLVVFNLRVEAQQSRIYRVGVLGPEKLEDRLQIKGLRAGLREAGYIENKNLELNIANVKIYDELRPIVKSYLENRTDAIVTYGGTATGIAREATKDIPIIFIYMGFGRPGENGIHKIAGAARDKYYRLEFVGNSRRFGKARRAF